MSSRAVTAWSAIAAACAAVALSLGRLVLGNPSALSSVVWAEDGLFPLCVRAHDPFSCTIDPWAGYLLFLPRVVAWPVSMAPLDAWPVAANAAAAVLAGLAAAVSVLILRVAGTGVVASVLVALLPTLAPIMGFEAINVTGSSYMLLVFVGALAVGFPPRDRFPTVAYSAGAVVTALTIPSSAFLLLPVGAQVLRGRIPRRGGLVVGASLMAGLIVQAIVAVTAANPRPMTWTLKAARSWVDTVPSALLSYWPADTALTPDGSFTSTAAAGWPALGVAVVALVTVLGLVLVLLRNAVANGIGWLLIVGVLMGVVPAAAGYANNRYFVIPALLWIGAALIAIDRWLPTRREWVMAVVGVVLIALWIPGLGASSFRSTPAPAWTDMLTAVRATCDTDPEGSAAITFTPTWPFADAKFPGPTNNVVPCSVLD